MIGRLAAWWRRRRAERLSIPDAAWDVAESGLPFLGHLSADERRRLRQLAREFIADKQWSGAQGLRVTPHMQLAIALQACLPILNLGLDWYRGWVGIVVYPGDFVIPRRVIDEDGVVHEYDDDVMGEAWYGGPVLLSWFDRPQDADGINVVIHEFAHKLDMLNGEADGVPALHSGLRREDWEAVLLAAYDDFCRRVDGGEETWIDPYGSDSPAEFFAVVSESFFESPDVVAGEYPELYRQLCRYYRQDPLTRLAAANPG